MVTQRHNKNAKLTHVQQTARLRPLNAAIHIALAGGLSLGALPGGLYAALPDPAAAWVRQANPNVFRLGTTTATFSDRNLRINQRDDKVVLNWDSFNIGAGNTVTFRQPGKDAVAINKIIGTDPSRIFGNLNANGQVYLINTNGILFGRGAQVNVHTLVASTLDMTQEAIDDGILAPNAGNAGNPAFEGTDSGAVAIQNGAVLRADGGRVLVFAPEIANNGLIQTPDGQTVLAAGQKIYLSSVELNDAAHPELVGQLLVEVDVGGVTPEALQAFLRGESPTLPSGTASNRGVIEALRGNVSMVGLAVNQNGRVSATTTVSRNGTIRLVAQDRSTGATDPVRGGRVQLGVGSTTEVKLELDSTATAVDAEAQPQSNVTLAGHSVHLERNARIDAKSGTVEISANAEGNDVPDGLANTSSNGSRIRIAEGARIDVSGAHIAMPVSANIIEVELRGAQLQNSPYQRDGILRNARIKVDIRDTGTREDGSSWVGTPLADVSGDVAAIKKTVGERSVEGGSVQLGSQGDVLVEQGSSIDVSGGSVQYQDDGVSTTKLVSNGRVYDIAEAPETLHYDRIINTYTKDYAKWGVRRVWEIVPNRREPGYAHGYDAGTVNVIASRGALEGALQGGVIVGPRQRRSAPQGGEFILGQVPSDLNALNLDLRSPDVSFTPVKRLSALLRDETFNIYGDALPDSFESIALSPDLFGEEAMHRGRIYSNGRILLPEDVDLIVPAGGALSLTAAQVDVQGDIVIPSGDIALKAVPINGDASLARIDVGAHSRLDTRGTWTNDNPLFNPLLGPIFTGGGSVNIASLGGTGVFLAQGSLIDISGGGWLDAAGELHAGDAGAIALSAASTVVTGYAPVELVSGGTLAGYALGRGGSLSVDANSLCIGGAAGCADTTGLRVDNGFFQRGGFNDYALKSNLNSLTVARDALIRPLAQSWLLNPGFALQPTGADLALFTRCELLPDVLRTPASLSLSVSAKDANGFSDANFAQAGMLNMQAGARILLNPLSSVSLASNTRMLIAGRIDAPAGSIELSLNNTLPLNGYIANQTIWLDESAELNARGVAQVQPNALGQREGDVYAGGDIRIDAQRGYVVTEAGSSLDVSGTAAELDLPNGNQGFVTRTVAGDAGNITVSAAEGLLLDGELHAHAGGVGAAGGQLSLALDGSNKNRNDGSDSFNFPDAPRTLQVANGTAAQIPDTLTPEAAADYAALNGQGRIAAARIVEGGFDRMELVARTLLDQNNSTLLATGTVRLDDGVRLHLKRDIRIDAAALASPGNAELAAAYVALGSTDRVTQDVAATTAGDGHLNIVADHIDVIGHSRIQQTATTTLDSRGDIRLRGVQKENNRELSGSLASDGDLNLRADQVYPTTLSDFTLEVTDDDGTLSILPGNGDTAPVLSAGGTLHLHADTIVQNGTLKAPIGSLDLVADESLVLGDGSLTSTSADGQIVPFGRLEAGEDWVYALQEARFRVFTGNGSEALPQKRVNLDGADIDVRDGAVVDVSGGGDLLAYEFVPGVDGTIDVLDPSVSPTLFAILPGSDLTYAPHDAQEMTNSTLQAGDSVYLSGSDGVAEGTYTLLPARYALLPGAYLVQAADGYRDLPIGQTIAQQNGTTIVSGYRRVAGTDIHDSRSSGFALRPGSDLAQFARYDTVRASDFFPAAAERNETATPRLPGDAGSLAIAPRNSLLLEGSLRAAAATGARGSAVDIVADQLAVTDTAGAAGGATLPAGFVQIDARQLGSFGAESLLLGALRTRGSEETALDVRAREVRVNGDVDLTVPDLVIAARERIQIDGGAQLTASGQAQTGDTVLRADGDGALLRLSADEQVFVDRGDSATGAQGDLFIGAGAQLNAAQSAVLDATRDAQSQGDLVMDGGSLNLGAYRISLGEAGAVNEGLVLGNTDLDQAQVDELVLTSRTSVDIHGAVNVNVNDLHIAAGGIHGYANNGQTAWIHARGDIALSNAEGVTDANAPAVQTGDGTLALNADERVVLGEGTFHIGGFEQVDLSAGREIVGDGTGTLRVAGDLTLHAPRITATKGADTTIEALDANAVYRTITITQPGTRPTDLQLADLGARMNVIGSRIDHDGSIELNAGLLNLEARGDAATDGVILRAGSTLDLSGRRVEFDGTPVYAGAGKLAVSSAHGDVTLNGDIDLSSGATGGGDAGRLTASAAHGALNVGGALNAQAGQGGRGGEARLDADDLGNVSALNTVLNSAGFDAQRELRQRSGDIVIAATDTVTAQDIQITADTGAIDVAGSLDASGNDGGRIQLNADQNLNIATTARLDASANVTSGDGGRVDLRSQNGGVFLDTGSVIDVRGGAQGHNGEVHLRLPRSAVLSVLDASTANDQLQLAATILGAAQKLLEGHQVYTEADGDISTAQVATTSTWYTQASSFVTAATGATTAAGDAEFVIRPGIEIRSPGDLRLSADWNLNAWRFNDQPGVLTLRAGGDLNIGNPATSTTRSSTGALSDGFASATTTTSSTSVVLPGASWSYRLVAGADQASADVLAVHALDDLPNGGDFKLANGTYSAIAPQTRVVRTGTGDIDIAAAQDFILGNAASVVYTAGEASGGIKLSALGATREYPDNGGDVRVRAGRDARGVEGNQLVTHWLFRAGRPEGSGASATGWTVAYERFQQGIGALGGGDVRVDAGRDIDNLSVAIPSIGKQIGGTAPTQSVVDIVGGGDLAVEAGRDIASGLYFVGKGAGRIEADGDVNSNRSRAGGGLSFPLHTVLALGDGALDVRARGDVSIESVINPTIMPQASANGGFTTTSYFFTYASDSAVSLNSTAGDIRFNNDYASLAGVTTGTVNWNGNGIREMLGVYAPNLSAHALGGDVTFTGSHLWLYPAPKGNLEVLADGNVNFGVGLQFILSDVAPSDLPSVTDPVTNINATMLSFLSNEHAVVPVHALENQPDGLADRAPAHVVARTGDLAMDDSDLQDGVIWFKSAKAVRFVAGQDLKDLRLEIQHVSDQDVSSLMAGRDLTYSTSRTEQGSLATSGRKIEVNGPGRLDVFAGRQVNLGTSDGIRSYGNLYNAALADRGANITVLAGVGDAMAIADFINAYARYFVADTFAAQFRAAIEAVTGSLPSDTETALAVYRGLGEEDQQHTMNELGLPERYAGSFAGDAATDGYFDDVSAVQTRMIGFARDYFAQADLSDTEAMQRFVALDENLQRQFVLESAFNELKWSGRVEARTSENDYPLGFAAIETLFPGDAYAGDIRMVLSTVRSTNGGDINLLAPGGRINAGLSTPPASLGDGKPASQLGVVAQSTGAVRVFADSDIQVEESRIFAGDGGDIIAWSSNGDVDAGRGSKTALSVPPPIVTFDAQGNATFVISGSLAGSGIRAFASSDGVSPGDVDLFAPRGVVNAGDAGIGGGNITLGATAILGADNIDVGGISVGVPVADTSSLAAGLTGISNLSSSVSKMAEASASSLGGEGGMGGNETLGFLSVEILGFGE
ncbi:MAG: filamentous hemagglutinin family protein [Gammaproteobacteria bacterium]|nr:filamentous hemagglutinin family protein [Gammaproteobacteria bacterium]